MTASSAKNMAARMLYGLLAFLFPAGLPANGLRRTYIMIT